VLQSRHIVKKKGSLALPKREKLSFLRLPFVRALIFCCLILILSFTNHLNVLIFFLLGGMYSLIESFTLKRGLDIMTGNKIIDFGWILFILGTVSFVVFELNQ